MTPQIRSPKLTKRCLPLSARIVRLFTVLSLVCMFWPVAATAQLTYVDCSPAGPAFPEWDGGDTGLCFADIDGDGNVDFVSIGDHGSPYINTDQHGIMVYFGDGAGGWSIHMEGNFGYGGIAVGDVNNDGLLDVGYGMHHNYSGSDLGDQLIEVALGDGTGISWMPWDDGLATNGETYGMFATALADFDADGDLDLASNSFGSGNGVHVYRNNGDGTWTQTFATGGGNSRQQLCCGDVNGDGYPDLAAAYQGGTIWLGDGHGGFAVADAGLPDGGSMGLGGVALGDVDGDGCADLAFVRNGGVQVYVWRTDHWESASSGLPTAGDYQVTQLWAMDGNGVLDVAAMGDGTLSVWLGDGAGNWSPGGNYYAGPAFDTAAFATGGDFDHNGRADVAVVQEEGSWPNYQNHLYAVREASEPTARAVVAQYPRGSETLLIGAVTVLRWSTAWVGDDPGSVTIELSTAGDAGPWVILATALPDNGHWQWVVAGDETTEALLRLTLHQSGEDVVTLSNSFRLQSGGATAVGDAGSAPWPAGPRLVLQTNPVGTTAHFRIEGGNKVVGNEGSQPTGDGLKVAIYTLAGQRVFSRAVAAGRCEWNLCDRSGRHVPAGIYLAQLNDPAGRTIGPAQRVVVVR